MIFVNRILTTTFCIVLCAVSMGSIFAADRENKSGLEGLKAYDARDFATAMQILRPLADGGDAKAKVIVGKMFSGGEGVSRDRQAAERYYSEAIRQGNSEAKYLLALIRLRTDDLQSARDLFEEAAADGNLFAKYELATLFANGPKAMRNPCRASTLYREIAQDYEPARRAVIEFEKRAEFVGCELKVPASN